MADPERRVAAPFSMGWLRAFLSRRLPAEDVDDTIQEVCVRILAISPAKSITCPRAYIFTIASRLAAKVRARALRVRLGLDSEWLDCCAASVTSSHSDPARIIADEDQLSRALASVPQNHRAVLLLRIQHGLSPQEIAKTLNLSLHSVKKYRHLGTRELRKEWSRLETLST